MTSFIVHIFKKILRADQKLWGCAIFKSKMACLPWKIIFSENPLVNLVGLIHVYLHKKSESDVNELTRYWRLKNIEIWLADIIFDHNLRTRFLLHM